MHLFFTPSLSLIIWEEMSFCSEYSAESESQFWVIFSISLQLLSWQKRWRTTFKQKWSCLIKQPSMRTTPDIFDQLKKTRRGLRFRGLQAPDKFRSKVIARTLKPTTKASNLHFGVMFAFHFSGNDINRYVKTVGYEHFCMYHCTKIKRSKT